MLTEDAPTLPNFDGDAVALESDYRNQPAAEVLAGLERAATAYAGALAALEDGQWQRTALRADGREFAIASLTRYGWHEIHHHLGDVKA